MGCAAAPAIPNRARWCDDWRPCWPRRELTPPHYRYCAIPCSEWREPRWAAQRPPAILSRTTVLRPVSQPRLLATRTGVSRFFVASRPAGAPVACDGPRSGPSDPEPGTVVRRLAALRAASGLAPLTTGFAVNHVARGRKLPMGCAAAPAIPSWARWCGDWRPCWPRRELTPPRYRYCAIPCSEWPEPRRAAQRPQRS
jgi:hypothetical protein